MFKVVSVTTFEPGRTQGAVIRLGLYRLPISMHQVQSHGLSVSARVDMRNPPSEWATVGNIRYLVRKEDGLDTISILHEDIGFLPAMRSIVEFNGAKYDVGQRHDKDHYKVYRIPDGKECYMRSCLIDGTAVVVANADCSNDG